MEMYETVQQMSKQAESSWSSKNPWNSLLFVLTRV